MLDDFLNHCSLGEIVYSSSSPEDSQGGCHSCQTSFSHGPIHAVSSHFEPQLSHSSSSSPIGGSYSAPASFQTYPSQSSQGSQFTNLTPSVLSPFDFKEKIGKVIENRVTRMRRRKLRSLWKNEYFSKESGREKERRGEGEILREREIEKEKELEKEKEKSEQSQRVEPMDPLLRQMAFMEYEQIKVCEQVLEMRRLSPRLDELLKKYLSHFSLFDQHVIKWFPFKEHTYFSHYHVYRLLYLEFDGNKDDHSAKLHPKGSSS